MKKLISIFLIGLLAMSTSQANDVSPSFECKFPSGEVIKYQTYRDVDFTHPLASGYGGSNGKKMIPVFVNGKGPVLYSLQILSTRIGVEIDYSFKDRFFINDTTIKYFPVTYNRDEYVTGEYRNDYAIFQLNCTVKR